MILNENLLESIHELESIKIPGWRNTWSSIDVYDVGNKRYFLMENDVYGDETNYLVITPDFKEIYETYDDIETALRDEGLLDNLQEAKASGLSNWEKIKRALDAMDENLEEDIEKTSKGKWVNRGKEGTHGEFRTKKAAREQQKAMFAQGYKENFYYIRDINEAQDLVDNAIKRFGRLGARLYDELDQAGFYVDVNNKVKYKSQLSENIGSDIAEYQKWVDYDMKKYGKISDDTNEKIKKAGLKVIKDRYNDYEVIASEPNHDVNEALYKTKSISGQDMTFEVTDDNRFIVKDGDDIILDTKVEHPEDLKKQIASQSRIETIKEDFVEPVVAVETTIVTPDSDIKKEESPKVEDNGMANSLIEAINDEWKTIQMYNDLIVNATSFGYPDMIETLQDIVNEENVHVGQLQGLLETISPNTSSINDGKEEAQEQITDTDKTISDVQ